jgi:hypothetical protein
VNIQDLINLKVKVDSYQTTFVTLKIDEKDIRIDFIDKREFSLEKGTTGPLKYFEAHPLLIDYNENIVTTYLNSKTDNEESFVADIQRAIDERTLGWRNWMSYVKDKNINVTIETFLQNIKKGSGKLLEAPFSITEKVIEVCEKHRVLTKTFGNELKADNYKLIMISDSYVIAKEFE